MTKTLCTNFFYAFVPAVWVAFDVPICAFTFAVTWKNDRDQLFFTPFDPDAADAQLEVEAEEEARADAIADEQAALDYDESEDAPETPQSYKDLQRARLRKHMADTVARAGSIQEAIVATVKRSVIPFNLFPDLSRRNYWKLQHTLGTTWIFGTYHKTGCELVVNMLARLKRRTTENINFVGDAIIEDRRRVFWPGKWDNFFFEPRLGVISLLPNYRMVHFTRSPTSIVISAYRFHTTCPAGEPWLFDPMSSSIWNIEMLVGGLKAHGRSDLADKFMFAVENNRTLCEFYKGADIPPEDGVILEAFRSQHELEKMSKNYVNTATDPKVLQVKLEDVMGNFQPTMICIFHFLSETRPVGNFRALLRRVEELSTPDDQAHVTTGKYDNTGLINIVHGIPHVMEAQKKMEDAGPGMRSCPVN